MEPRPIFNGNVVYRERGAFLRRQEQIEKAKAAYDVAFDITQEDVQQLLGRSQVCSDAVMPELAYENAEKALRLEPGNMNARNMQARAMYTMSDFERSLVMNYRGSWHRKKPPYFLEGISQGVETIEDCVGKRAGTVMLDFLPLIMEHGENMGDEDEPKKIKHVSRIPQAKETKTLTQMEARQQHILTRVMAMKYLGAMAADKFFLEDLSRDDNLMSASKKSNAALKDIVNTAMANLAQRQDILRTQRPYYSIKFAEKTHSNYQIKFKEQLLKKEQFVNVHTANIYVRAMEKCLRSNAIVRLMDVAERMQLFLDNKTPKTLPDKNVFIDRLYRIVGEGFLAQHRLSYKLSERSNRRRIAFLMGLPTGRPTSYDSVRANYPTKFVDVGKTILKTMETLRMCENDTMKCYLLYELARLQRSQKNYAQSRFFAKRCQRQAQQISSAIWWLNGCFIMIGGDMQQGNANEVRAQVEEAVSWAKQLPSAASGIRTFLYKCLEVVSETAASDELKEVRKRERDILKVMEQDDQSRVNTQVLFKRISTLPAGRRFKVLPQRRALAAGAYTSERRKRAQPGLTVVPGQVKELPKPPKSHVLGFQIFDN